MSMSDEHDVDASRLSSVSRLVKGAGSAAGSFMDTDTKDPVSLITSERSARRASRAVRTQ